MRIPAGLRALPWGFIAPFVLIATFATAANYAPWKQPSGDDVPGSVLNCATGQGRTAVPCGNMASPLNVSSMPFVRLHSAPIRLKGLTTTPKTFAISRPAGATTYRVVVPCDVDVRLLGTMNSTDAVTDDTGVLYLARTEATMGTSKPTYISAKTVTAPTGDCTPEMHYGTGGG